MPSHYTAAEFRERERRAALRSKQPVQLSLFDEPKKPMSWTEERKLINGISYLVRCYGNEDFVKHEEHILLQ